MKLPPREWNTQEGSRESRGEEWTNEENRFPISRSLWEGGEKEKKEMTTGRGKDKRVRERLT